MMNCFIRLGCSVLLMASSAVQAVVTVQYQSEKYQFTTRPRLADVIASLPVSAHQAYWPQAALYRVDDQSQLDKQALQQQLTAFYHYLQTARDQALANSVLMLQQQVESWPVASRIELQLDYDLARTQLESNPMFDAGDYLLTAAGRRANIHFSGLVSKTSGLHIAGKSAASYCKELTRQLPGADSTSCVMQRPDGTISVIVADTTKSTIETVPGSQLIVQFEPSVLPEQFQTLNQLLIAVARNRIFL
jgi:hypothetical protein